jgi:hypothetical protein
MPPKTIITINKTAHCCQDGFECAEKHARSGDMASCSRQGDDDRGKTCFKVA